MADQPLDQPYTARPIRPSPRPTSAQPAPVPRERRRGFWVVLDKPLIVIVGLLVAIGLMMVYSTTFDWSYAEFGDPSTRFLIHLRNTGIAFASLVILVILDYHILRRFAVLMMLVTIGTLIAVLLFADVTFGARRALIAGSLQPGELSELVVVIYMAAWLSSKKTRIRSITYGLIPFIVLLSIISGLVLLQPDLSTAAVILGASGIMFFLAGADIKQLLATGLLILIAVLGIFALGLVPNYAPGRVDSFLASISDLTRADDQVQEAINAFIEGGWFGVGLGEGRQKFGILPAAHTDSIFAIIGEELGVVGASVVVALYVAFVVRGFQIARRALDPFGALLAAGLTVWVALKALLNIAVMLALVPTTGVPLPFISYGGSSIFVLLSGVGILLSIQRYTASHELTPERRVISANYDRGGRHGRSRVSRARRSRSATATGE